jgi:hypothetical protein
VICYGIRKKPETDRTQFVSDDYEIEIDDDLMD